ncbi:MAG: ribosomal protein S6 modification protein, ribosomal protein S6 modification protein [Candidatus Peregrinibacteria bacterium GW2011_GWF2_38_29]|nr:MAG: ribosomal protein S6 modification protein, ribosomal protein S6 modification protein [Candidatus Peregrinibacteria bacterium GW2011_GWF2_38_29]HBB02378.1 30S ribosomal protein S6--L-glutamate ligase [Candidatus Peregrinibacteria bacterium]
MKIAVLTFESIDRKSSKEDSRIVQAARELGHKARIFRADKCQLVYDRHNPRVFYDGSVFPDYDVIIPRVGLLRNIELQAALVKQLQLMGFPVVNTFHAISRAKNKLRTMQILDHFDIPIPKTIVVRDLKYINADILKQVNAFPVILKTPFGSYGSGVVIAESKRAVMSALSFLWKQSGVNIILLQEYMKESKGKDVRVFVVGNKVVATMIRSAKKGEFRSNIELGGKGEKTVLTKREIDVAIKSVKVLKLEIGGVDIIRSKKGPLVLEVNANPGFKSLEEVTGVDVAKAIVEYAVEKAKLVKLTKEEA